MKKSVLLIAALGFLGVAVGFSEPLPDYNRRNWGNWIDADKDCQDTRQEVLIAESLEPVQYKTEKGCQVLSGLWMDLYTGTTFTDPSKLDIDHMVPLRAAHHSGGGFWDRNKKRQYANDLGNPDHLIAVSASANRSKGARAPHEWLPPNPDYRCQYLNAWVSVKADWDLSSDPIEDWALWYMKATCEAGHIPVTPQ